jgi:protein-S-isoprenylcysteine O-methyltransferase Ste14
VNFGLRNFLIFAGLYCLQVVRMIREERLLSEDPEYRTYQKQVRYRFLTRIF